MMYPFSSLQSAICNLHGAAGCLMLFSDGKCRFGALVCVDLQRIGVLQPAKQR
jgi:hypothetical protein